MTFRGADQRLTGEPHSLPELFATIAHGVGVRGADRHAGGLVNARGALALWVALVACSVGCGADTATRRDVRGPAPEAAAAPVGPGPASSGPDAPPSQPADARAATGTADARDAAADAPAAAPPKMADAASERTTPDVAPFFTDGGAPFKCATGMPYPASCEIYCACWFQLCAPMTHYACVFTSAARCMDECKSYTNLAYALYRVNNQPLAVHCGDSLPDRLKPGADAGSPCP